VTGLGGIRAGRRWGARLALVAGVLTTATGVGLAVAPAPPVPEAGALPQRAQSASVPASPQAGGTTAPPSALPSAPAVPPAPAGGPPRQVRIADLALVADVDPAGVDDGRRLDIPADPRRLGWWIGAARPGDAQGTVLLAGHVDTADAGRGALFRLESLPMGATVEVAAGGQVFRYRVTARRSYAKTRLPADLFAAGGAPRLVLVTCGGRFRAGAYDSNVVVYADQLP
jgi:hypothetical protein